MSVGHLRMALRCLHAALSCDRLPIGLILTERYGDDATLLRLAAQTKQACPWTEKVPPVVSQIVEVVQ